MQMEQYQNIVVISIINGKYTKAWVYRADAVNPDKEHGWDSLPVYLSALRQAAVSPEVHKRGNGEDQHLYYIPTGKNADIEKAKSIAFARFASWKQPESTMPDYVCKFVFKKKQDAPVKAEIFRKDSQNDAKAAYLKAYRRSVLKPFHTIGSQQYVIYWHGNDIRQITEEVNAFVFDRWKNTRLLNLL